MVDKEFESLVFRSFEPNPDHLPLLALINTDKNTASLHPLHVLMQTGLIM